MQIFTKKWISWLFALFIIGGVLWGYRNGLGNDFRQFLEIENLRNTVEGFGVFAPVVFMGIYYLVVLAFFSAAIFTVLSGVLFGPFWGSVYVIIAATAAAQTAFFITQWVGAGRIQQLKQKKGIGALIVLLEEKCEKNGFRNFFILRCLFLPYIPLSYAAGLVKTARPWDFFWATLLTNMIFSPAFVLFGDSLLEGPKALLLPVGLIFLVLLVPRIVRFFQSRKH